MQNSLNDPTPQPGLPPRGNNGDLKPTERPEIDFPFIFRYTRVQALADGLQRDVSALAKEAGFRIPVYVTNGVYAEYVSVPAGVEAQDETGRLWDVLWMLRYAITKAPKSAERLKFTLHVRQSETIAKAVHLVAVCGPVDVTDPSPALTIMLPIED